MNNFIKEQKLDNCILEQLINRKEFEENLIEIVIKLFENESSLLLFNFKKELEDNNRLKDVEELYNFTNELSDIYKRCLNIFNKNYDRLESKPIKEILSGIIEVIKSDLVALPEDVDNMITFERITIISNSITKMKQIIKDSVSEYVRHNLSKDFSHLKLKDMIEIILKDIMENNIEKIKELHRNSLKELNQYDKRNEAKKYMGIISLNKKNLSVFQSIKAKNLINQDDISNTEQTEFETIKQILTVVREVYKKLEHKENKMFDIINHMAFSMDTIHNSFEALMNYQQIMQHMSENEELMDCFKKYKEKKRDIINRLLISISDEIYKSIMFAVRDIAEASKGFEILSCQVVQTLKMAQLIDIHDAQLISLPKQENKIARAIIEAVNIKYESLKEKTYTYTLTKNEDFVKYEKTLNDSKEELINNISRYFEEMLTSENKPFEKAHEKFKRLIKDCMDNSMKKDIEFLKNDLLFEILSLEEIVISSLPKLEATDNELCREIVLVINECYSKIEKVIAKSGIEVIEPEIHDKFNGKEQEVIIVEENKDFSKGEIISVYSKGYKYQNIPIIRANVVAAG